MHPTSAPHPDAFSCAGPSAVSVAASFLLGCRESDFPSLAGTHFMLPRFWLQGDVGRRGHCTANFQIPTFHSLRERQRFKDNHLLPNQVFSSLCFCVLDLCASVHPNLQVCKDSCTGVIGMQMYVRRRPYPQERGGGTVAQIDTRDTGLTVLSAVRGAEKAFWAVQQEERRF